MPFYSNKIIPGVRIQAKADLEEKKRCQKNIIRTSRLLLYIISRKGKTSVGKINCASHSYVFFKIFIVTNRLMFSEQPRRDSTESVRDILSQVLL